MADIWSKKLADDMLEAVEAETKRRIALEGRYYASPIEGYGDLTGAMTEVDGALKECRKLHKELLGSIRLAKGQALYDKLCSLRVGARTMTVLAAKMTATVERYIQTIAYMTGGGDLIDMMNGMPEEDRQEELPKLSGGMEIDEE